MLNYWWVTRPKRKLDSIPEVLAAFADISLNQEWEGQRGTQLKYEEALEKAGLKRVGQRRDQSGSGGRTYQAWLESLGLIFHQAQTKQIKLTLAGEAIMNGESPVKILTWQVLKYQFPSAFSVSRGVQVNPRFRIHPFIFLLRLMDDSRIQYLTQDEIAKVIAVEAENESDRCYEYIVERILQYRSYGDSCLDKDFFIKYKPSKGSVNPSHPYSHLQDCANTMENWLEYTQLAKRDDDKHLVILDEKRDEVKAILNQKIPFVDRPDNHEFYQRKYGLDPDHRKDTRNLEKTKTITARTIAEMKIKQAYIRIAIKKPIFSLTTEIIDEISDDTGITDTLVEDIIRKNYPHGSIGAFMASYFEMAFKGTEEAVDFEKATTEIFDKVFGYNATHLGQTGSKSAPDILLISDSEGYQSIIDNKAYSKYSITGDHHNRMVQNYIRKIGNYSKCTYPIGYFAYISGGFINTFDSQVQKEIEESGVSGSGITVSNFIKMIENQTSGKVKYSHRDLRTIFSIGRQIRLTDIENPTRIYKDVPERNASLRKASDLNHSFGDDNG
ncbi:restriction endonuclease FokI C-terminal domain-containing protein [uncultured Dialister sp.]|uniref:restriction endonuclease FokI C-terminal domain-containing protein n=1 Tax=uncultured Dialister sp. TaxID=278064 RepID=UPI0025F7288F|nr:restriction endonuclease FokI C-terminal domain-containing protein [uncultured Dialister sp.]